MAEEFHIPFKVADSQEAREAVAKSIAKHKSRITVNAEGVRVTFSDDAVRTIVREELAAFKAEIVKQVMSDLAKEMHLQQRGSHER